MSRDIWIHRKLNSDSRRNRFRIIPWLAGGIIIFALLYGTSHIALLSLPKYEDMDMKSQLDADYSVWESLVFEPVDPAILEEIKQERGLPEQLVIDDPDWSTPVVSFPTLPPIKDDIEPTPQATSEPAPVHPTIISTPMPTNTVSPAQSTVIPKNTQPTRPTKTRKPHKTPKPPKTN